MAYEVKYTLKDYMPVFVVFAVAFAGGFAVHHLELERGLDGLMVAIMGMVLFVFAAFKLVNITGFAKGLQKYDPLAQRFAAYAYAVPFLELGLGLTYLAHLDSLVFNSILLAYALYNAISVKWALHKGLDVRCACLGTALDLPLSSVTFYENVFMAAMAVGMIAIHG
jgi:hypothetical protein